MLCMLWTHAARVNEALIEFLGPGRKRSARSPDGVAAVASRGARANLRRGLARGAVQPARVRALFQAPVGGRRLRELQSVHRDSKRAVGDQLRYGVDCRLGA